MGDPVTNVDAYLQHLSISSHQLDDYFSICFMFAKNKLFHADTSNGATYGGDFMLKYVAMMFKQTLWTISHSGKGTLLMKIAPPNSHTEKRLHLYLANEHYEWLQRVKDDSMTDGSPQCHFLTNCIVVRGIFPLVCACCFGVNVIYYLF